MKIKELQQREEQREEFIKRTKNLLEFSEEMFESKEPKKRGRVRRRKERKKERKKNCSKTELFCRNQNNLGTCTAKAKEEKKERWKHRLRKGENEKSQFLVTKKGLQRKKGKLKWRNSLQVQL